MKKGGLIPKILIAIVVLGIIGAVFGGGKGDDSSSTSSKEPETKIEQTDTTSGDEAISEEAQEESQPEASEPSIADSIPNELVADFVRSYNSTSEDPFTSIESISDIAYRGVSHGYTIQMNGLGNGRLVVEIQNNGDYAGMRQTFYEAANSIDPAIGDAAYEVFDQSVASLSPTSEDVIAQLGSLDHVDFSPENEWEDGHIQLVIDY